jgi:NAD(P)-dependent dehydrogenase (short-subunit alcohol dehydrogenase family)
MTTRKPSMKGYPDPTLKVTAVPADGLDLTGKRVAVVGGTDGLGRAIARLAASRGARVVVIGRTFRDEGAPNLSFLKADLSSMAEAARIGRELPADLDVVVLTTGIFAAKTRQVTAEGIERDMAVSYLSRFVIVRELVPRLTSPAPRVFVMGLPGGDYAGDPADLNGEAKYEAMAAHINTVAANEALVLHGAKTWDHVRFFGLNPGLIKTNIRANYMGDGSLLHRVSEALIGLFMPSADTYAARVLPLLVAPELETRSGAMFGGKGNPILPSEAMTDERVSRFVAASEALVARALAGAAAS